MSAADGTVWIAYNGEIYNSPALRKALKEKNCDFRTTSDTEVILKLYLEDPMHFVERLDGIFAFALWDARPGRRELILARDFLGVKPLYVHQGRDVLVFGSEVKALLVEPRVPCAVDRQGLMEILAFQNTYPCRTCFKDIRLMDVGEVLTVRPDGRSTTRRYWTFSPSEPIAPRPSLDESARRLAGLCESAITSQLLSDVPVASYLSGGMDTGVITSIAARSVPGLHTFSGGFNLNGVAQAYHGFDERHWAELMSRHFNTQHHFREIQPEDLMKCFADISWHLEEPRASTCYAPWVMAREAGSHVKVILSGHGGDELFAGYKDRYRMAAAYGSNWEEQWFKTLNYVIPESEFADALDPAFADMELRQWPRQVYWEFIGNHRSMSPQARAQYHDLFVYMSGLLLIEDKMSMAHGLESRVPLLDRRLFDFAWGLPDEWKLSATQGKAILRKAMEGVIPQAILDRDKMGFGPPDDAYYRTRLKGFFDQLLMDGSLARRQIVMPSAIKQIVERQRNGAPLAGTLWTLASVELWHRTFIDRAAALRHLDTDVSPISIQAQAAESTCSKDSRPGPKGMDTTTPRFEQAAGPEQDLHVLDLVTVAKESKFRNAAVPTEKETAFRLCTDAEGALVVELPPLAENEYSQGFNFPLILRPPAQFKEFVADIVFHGECQGCSGVKDFIQVLSGRGESMGLIFPTEGLTPLRMEIVGQAPGSQVSVRLLAQNAAGQRCSPLRCRMDRIEVRYHDTTRTAMQRIGQSCKATMRHGAARALSMVRRAACGPGRLLLPAAFRVYAGNWLRQTSGRSALELRRRLESHRPDVPPPQKGDTPRIFQGLYATVQPSFLKAAWQTDGVPCRYETLDWNPHFDPPDTYHSIAHPSMYQEQVRFDGSILLPPRLNFWDDYTINALWDLLVRRWAEYDVFHFGWFLSFLPDNADVEFLRRSGRAVYFHFRGCFILSKIADRFASGGGGVADACAHCKRMGWRDRYFARFHKATSQANRVFVSTPNLCHCSPEFEYIPLSLEGSLASLPARHESAQRGKKVVVVHAVGAAHYAVKGTEHIRHAVASLAAEGLDVELRIIENMPRSRAVDAMRNGDILVEQLNLGSYGNVAVEGMAHGLPVISSLHPTVAHLIPGSPIVHADPGTVQARLRELVTDSSRREKVGRQSYEFVRSFHANRGIASHLLRIFRSDLSGETTAKRNTLGNANPSYE